MISSLLHLVGLRPRVYYTLINFRGGGARPPWPPPQYANVHLLIVVILHEFTCVHETKVVMFIFIILRERNVLRRAKLNNIVCATRK